MVNGNLLTVYLMLLDVVPDLKPGEWILQDAANSNCGGFVIQLARHLGYRTVNVVRRPGLEDQVLDGGGDVVVVDGPDLAKRVAAATGGAPIRLALDMVAGETTGRLAACLAPFGTVACYGQVSGQDCRVPVPTLLFSQTRLVGFLTGPWLARSSRGATEIDRLYDQLSDFVVRGIVNSTVAGVYPFARVAEALRRVQESGSRRGKVLLTPR
jgi:NADPH:quinone reductase-like Zn-dependent oxidoreductase